MKAFNLQKVLCLFFVFICIVINIITLKDGHNWGDDFAQYIINAKNIVEGNAFSSGVMIDNPVLYPPGFSLLLSIPIRFFGVNFIVLKLLNVIFWYGAIFIIYKILKNEVGVSIARLFALVLCSSPYFFIFKQNILSDIPFLFFLMASIYFMKTFYENQEIRLGDKCHLLLGVLFMGASYLIRSAGIVLFLASLSYSFFGRKKYKEFLFIISGLGIAVFLQYLFINMEAGCMMEIKSVGWVVFIHNILTGMYKVFGSAVLVFYPIADDFWNQDFLLLSSIFKYLSPIIFSGLVVLFVHKLKEKSLKFLDLCIFFYVVILALWSFFQAPLVVYSRFWIPFIYPLFMLFFHGVEFILPKIFFIEGKRKVFWFMHLLLGIMIFVNIQNIHKNINFNDDVLCKKENVELFDWVKNNLDESDVYLCDKARAVALMTERVGIERWVMLLRKKDSQSIELVSALKGYDISYVIIEKGKDEGMLRYLNDNGALKVWENSSYVVINLRKKSEGDYAEG